MSTPDAAASARRTQPTHAVPVHKVLNNNVVIAIDESGRERVLMGRGLAFGLKPDDAIDPAKVEKTFILDSGDGGENELRLLSEVPYPVLEAVTRAVDGAERSLRRALGRGFTIAVLNHIQFVLERPDQEAILAHLGIDAADAIGIGDNWNDAEMFEVCGTAIAMGNAVDGVKALADQVTTAIDDDGILRAFAANGLI
ncbi:CAT RNA binding domain-containing protein [Microbacterium aurum]